MARVEDFRSRREAVGTFQIQIESYRHGDVYYCRVDNVDPGAIIARSTGRTREEAEEVATEKARRRIARTRIRED